MIAQERGHRHQNARRAEAALQSVRFAKGGLQRIQLAVRTGEALDGLNLVTVGLHGEHDAGARRLAVEQNRARAAHAVLAADVRAGEAEVLAQEIAEQEPRLDAAFVSSPLTVTSIAIWVLTRALRLGRAVYCTRRPLTRTRLVGHFRGVEFARIMAPGFIGRAVPRKEGRAKVTGEARYVDDLTLPGMLHGVTVRSPAPRGRIRDIRFEGDLPWDEFTIVTARDVPPPNRIALILNDQPCLADDVVNHAEEPVVLLAHPDKGLVEKARRFVAIDIDPLPSVHYDRRRARRRRRSSGATTTSSSRIW